MDRQTILDTLKTDLKEKLNVANDYKSEPIDIIEGVAGFNNIVQRPIIGYTMVSDIINNEYMGDEDASFDSDNERERILTIVLFGQEDVSYKSYDPLYNLIHDVEKFIISTDWTYHKTTMLGDVGFWIGEIDFNQAYFTVEIQVYYTQTLT